MTFDLSRASWWIRQSAGPLLVATLVLGLTFNIATAQDQSTPTTGDVQIGVLDGEPVLIACDENVVAAEGSDATPIPATSPASVFALVSEESAARYVAEEELANVGANTAIGETNAFIGSLYFDADGKPLPCSRWDVDMRTLVSDESRRDNFLRGNTLETDTYPVATFVLTAVEGLDGPLADGEESSFHLVGNLTFHGVTNLVRWEATATLDGDSLIGSASTTFDMADYDIDPPIVGSVLSIDETVTLEVDIVAAKAS